MSEVEVVIIGGGPAGCTAAVEAARTGKRVALVMEEKPGGRAAFGSMVPSKIFLHAAERRRQRGELQKGLADEAEMTAIHHEVQSFSSRISARWSERLEDAGVRRIEGVAKFTSAYALSIARVGKEPLTLRFAHAIIATGSVPYFPESFFGADLKGPDGVHILAPRHLSAMTSLPKTMLVIGGGVTGAEMVHAFTSLGVEVSWVMDDLGILPRFDRELASSLGDVLMERGAKLVHGKGVLSVMKQGGGVQARLDGGRTYEAERAFVAIGRTPDTGRLGLEHAGVEVHPRGSIPVDALGRTNVPHIYAVGDAAGAPFTVTKACAEAYAAAHSATGQEVTAPVHAAWIEAVYADPEVARVGMTPEEGARRGLSFEVCAVGFDAALRGMLDGAGTDKHARGMLKVVFAADGRVLGGIAVGRGAVEALSPVATAIHLGASRAQLRGLFLASPSLSELGLDAFR
jgi:dihydrolipoamide dehydrogenase